MNFNELIQQLNLGIFKTHEVIKGGNSVVVKTEKSDGSYTAVKIYQGTELRKSIMLNREVNAINFLRENGLSNLPANLEVRKDLGLITYDWIQGITPTPDKDCIKSIASMCLKLYDLRAKNVFFDNAIDAAFSASEIESQIQTRLLRLRSSNKQREFSQLLDGIDSRLLNFSNKENQISIVFNKTFSISDLGSHNMLVNKNQFFFIDFEFFGVDSTEKMLGDFLLHPRNEFSKQDIDYFLKSISNTIAWNRNDFKNILLMLTLKWVTISLDRVLRNQKSQGDVDLVSLIEQSYAQNYLDYFDFLYEDPMLNLSTFRNFNDKIL